MPVHIMHVRTFPLKSGMSQKLPVDTGIFGLLRFVIDDAVLSPAAGHGSKRNGARHTRRADLLQLVYGTTVEAWS